MIRDSITYQSPISPGIAWYEASVLKRPQYPTFDNSRQTDVVIVGGGYTGLSAAYHLAASGTDVVLLDAARFGDGASGRNGGQLNTGQRIWAEDLELELGLNRAKALFNIAEEAKTHLLQFAVHHKIAIDYLPGHMSLVHKSRYLKHYQAHPERMAIRFNYPHLHFMDAVETAERLGSKYYHGGIYDKGTGHIHPMKLLIGTAKAAAKAGAHLFENSRITKLKSENNRVIAVTKCGTVTASKCLLATNAYGSSLEPVSAAHIMPIRSFMGATVPFGEDHRHILPGRESVDDSRFVVRYFRRIADGRLLFGGREAYMADNPSDIRLHIRRQIREIYPKLADIEISHAWGGSVGITRPRLPFVREVMPNVMSVGGYSGHGLILSHFIGKLYAESIAGKRECLKLFQDLRIPAFPGGRCLRTPLLFLALTWYALVDRM